MPVFDQPSTSSVHPNVFTTQFLARLAERDDEDLVSAVNVAVQLLQAPESLAWLLEAAGGVALEAVRGDPRRADDGDNGGGVGPYLSHRKAEACRWPLFRIRQSPSAPSDRD